MSEFRNDEQRDTYIQGLLNEQAEAEQHIVAAKDAGASLEKLDEHLASVKAELARVGVKAEDEKKADAAEKRPAKPAAETR